MTLRAFGYIAGLACLMVGSCAGCAMRSTLVAPDLPYWAMHDDWSPEGAYAVTPDSMWLAEYAAAESCSGLRGDVSKVRWHLVPGKDFEGVTTDGTRIRFVGYSIRGDIYIAESRKNFEWIIRHESLHDILQGGGHNTTLFGERCRAMEGYFE